jgi:hypothetical protein
MDDPTEYKVAYLAVVSHPAGETVAHLIDEFLQRRLAQRLWFAWFRSGHFGLHFGYVVAKLPRSVPPHPFRGSHRLWVLWVTSPAHARNIAHSSRRSRSSATRTLHCFPFQNVVERFGQQAVQGIPDKPDDRALAERFSFPCLVLQRRVKSAVQLPKGLRATLGDLLRSPDSAQNCRTGICWCQPEPKVRAIIVDGMRETARRSHLEVWTLRWGGDSDYVG